MAGRENLQVRPWPDRPGKDRQEKVVFTHPEVMEQLAAGHQRQMLAEASQRRLWHQRSRWPSKRPGAAVQVTRRLAAAIANAGVVAAEIPGTVRSARPQPLADPGDRTSTPGRRVSK
jgi:hypothetical protein